MRRGGVGFAGLSTVEYNAQRRCVGASYRVRRYIRSKVGRLLLQVQATRTFVLDNSPHRLNGIGQVEGSCLWADIGQVDGGYRYFG